VVIKESHPMTDLKKQKKNKKNPNAPSTDGEAKGKGKGGSNGGGGDKGKESGSGSGSGSSGSGSGSGSGSSGSGSGSGSDSGSGSGSSGSGSSDSQSQVDGAPGDGVIVENVNTDQTNVTTNEPEKPPEPEKPLWEKVWSMDQLREATKTNKWSLASDAGLLNFVKDFSQKFIEKTQTTQKSLNELFHDTQSCEVKLNNTFNKFIMLSSTQYVENRVMDDFISKPKEPEKVETEKEPENVVDNVLMPKYKDAINSVLNVMHKFNIHDEDADIKDLAVQKKDYYNRKPLPFLIGSSEYNEEKNLNTAD